MYPSLWPPSHWDGWHSLVGRRRSYLLMGESILEYPESMEHTLFGGSNRRAQHAATRHCLLRVAPSPLRCWPRPPIFPLRAGAAGLRPPRPCPGLHAPGFAWLSGGRRTLEGDAPRRRRRAGCHAPSSSGLSPAWYSGPLASRDQRGGGLSRSWQRDSSSSGPFLSKYRSGLTSPILARQVLSHHFWATCFRRRCNSAS